MIQKNINVDDLAGSGGGPIHMIMDISDGSLLSILATLHLKKMNKSNSQLKVVSRETKLFSRMFHGQLAEKNGLDDVLMLWNGESAVDIITYFSGNDSESGILITLCSF